MRAFVFTDASLTSRAGQFVWLAVDNENAKNAKVLAQFPVDALPTFRVVDPRTEAVLLERVGSFTVAQLHAFLDEARVAWAAPTTQRAADAALFRADASAGKGQYAEAGHAYREALAAAPPDWPSRARVVESALFADQKSEAWPACVVLARESATAFAGTPTALAAATTGLDCALNLAAGPEREAAIAGFEAAVRETIADPRIEVAADDRSGAYDVLLQSRKDAKDAAGARRVAEDWAAFLERNAAAARSPEQRTVFDSFRLATYLELEQPQRAIPMLEASERDFPEDYNPPARLALAYQALGDWDRSLAASERALRHVYGPRTLRVLKTKAEVLEARGDLSAARRVVEEAGAFNARLEDTRVKDRAAPIEKRLADLRGREQAVADAVLAAYKAGPCGELAFEASPLEIGATQASIDGRWSRAGGEASGDFHLGLRKTAGTWLVAEGNLDAACPR